MNQNYHENTNKNNFENYKSLERYFNNLNVSENKKPEEQTIKNILNYSKSLRVIKSEFTDHIQFILN